MLGVELLHRRYRMAKPNIAGMNVEMLLELRKRLDEHLLQRRTDMEKQLARLGGTRVC